MQMLMVDRLDRICMVPADQVQVLIGQGYTILESVVNPPAQPKR